MTESPILQKTLTANDVGATGSHQAGIHVPSGLAWYFPPLDGSQLNPDDWLDIRSTDSTYSWRWIHYNNGVVADGTRDEFRLTHTAAFLRSEGAREGDILELIHLGGVAYSARVRKNAQSGLLVLSTAGAWRTVAIRS